MGKIFSIVISFLAIVVFSGCGDNISMVKKGTLEFDKSISIGQAFDKYKYFKKTEWKELVTDNGKKVVQVEGIVDFKLFPEDFYVIGKENIQEARIVAQFTINKDDTFNLSYYGQEMIKIDGKEDAVRLNDYGVKMGIKAIYENKPTW